MSNIYGNGTFSIFLFCLYFQKMEWPETFQRKFKFHSYTLKYKIIIKNLEFFNYIIIFYHILTKKEIILFYIFDLFFYILRNIQRF